MSNFYKTPAYISWDNMIQRCTNKNHNKYKDYGGRGIAVCKQWLHFSNFLASMGDRPIGTTLDRYPNGEGNYEPGNCRWASIYAQNINRRRKRIGPRLKDGRHFFSPYANYLLRLEGKSRKDVL